MGENSRLEMCIFACQRRQEHMSVHLNKERAFVVQHLTVDKGFIVCFVNADIVKKKNLTL